jgi:hypothetical protein
MRYIIFALALLTTSCGSRRDYGGHPPYPASGKVMVNGQPVKGARVTLHGGAVGPDGTAPQGWTGDDGTFVLSTYDANDGAPVGDYTVSIIWLTSRREGSPDRLNQKYAKPESSGLNVKIEAKKNVLLPFELSVDPATIKTIEEAAKDPRNLKTHHNK